MKSRGILMTTVMVESLLKGIKTETRRGARLKEINETPNDWTILKIEQSEKGLVYTFSNKHFPEWKEVIKCPYGVVGDGLWVRETFVYVTDPFQTTENVLFWADGKTKRLPDGTFKEGQLVHNWESDPDTWKKQPSLFMPRAASRFNLEITDVSLERLQDITEEGAIAEGVEYSLSPKGSMIEGIHYRDYFSPCVTYRLRSAIDSYRSLFELINGKGSWESNPWVWVVKFKNVTKK